jgi:hypothetical protein
MLAMFLHLRLDAIFMVSFFLSLLAIWLQRAFWALACSVAGTLVSGDGLGIGVSFGYGATFGLIDTPYIDCGVVARQRILSRGMQYEVSFARFFFVFMFRRQHQFPPNLLLQ